jgi:hypothetical protein
LSVSQGITRNIKKEKCRSIWPILISTGDATYYGLFASRKLLSTFK